MEWNGIYRVDDPIPICIIFSAKKQQHIQKISKEITDEKGQTQNQNKSGALLRPVYLDLRQWTAWEIQTSELQNAFERYMAKFSPYILKC